jgi:hypothetical protein
MVAMGRDDCNRYVMPSFDRRLETTGLLQESLPKISEPSHGLRGGGWPTFSEQRSPGAGIAETEEAGRVVG